jgi:thiamine-monophosphate kinase
MHLGYKAAIVNFSDIYAMNGDVTQITVSIAVSNRFSVEAIEELYKGIHKACELYKVDLVGGDTTSSTSGLVISITAIGEVEKELLVLRSGGKENELISGVRRFGWSLHRFAGAGKRKETSTNQILKCSLIWDGKDYILERQLKPEARKDVVHFLKELGVKLLP